VFQQGGLQGGALGGGEGGVEPVVADGDGGGHFGDVEKMGRIPVVEGRDGEQFLLCALEETCVARQAKRERACQHAAEGGAGFVEESRADEDVLDRGGLQFGLGKGDDARVELRAKRIALRGGDGGGQLRIVEQQPWVAGPERGERIGFGRKGGQRAKGEGKGGKERVHGVNATRRRSGLRDDGRCLRFRAAHGMSHRF
jgi:hypothetical protein